MVINIKEENQGSSIRFPASHGSLYMKPLQNWFIQFTDNLGKVNDFGKVECRKGM